MNRSILMEFLREEVRYVLYERQYLNEAEYELPLKDIQDSIKNSKGKIFTVTFIKKDGTQRVMNARLGVKAYLKGGELPYDPAKFNYLPVFDLRLKKYRILNLNTIQSLKVGGDVWKVKK